MSNIVKNTKVRFRSLFVWSMKDNWISFLLLFFAGSVTAQISPADSISYADSVKIWEKIPVSDSMPDWQTNTAIAVFYEKINGYAGFLQQYAAEKTAQRTTVEEALALAQQDTTVSKETLNQLKSDLKVAKVSEKKAKQALKEATGSLALVEKTNGMEPAQKRKNIPKLQKKAAGIEKTWAQLTAPPPPPPAPPANEPDPVPPPPVDAVVPVPTDTTVIPVTTEVPNKKKKTKEKAPEKPGFARYNPQNDVNLNPPKAPCVLGVNRRDEFTGNVYREMKYAELFRYTNSVMKKILPVTQPHILCKAALASDASGGTLWLNFTIKDANARRTFGGIAQKSIVSLKFINGEIITLFNESTQEVRFDPEQGVAIFTGQYPFQAGIFKKLEKMELDQIRVAWATGYEDYSVQQVGLLQQQASCLK